MIGSLNFTVIRTAQQPKVKNKVPYTPVTQALPSWIEANCY